MSTRIPRSWRAWISGNVPGSCGRDAYTETQDAVAIDGMANT